MTKANRRKEGNRRKRDEASSLTYSIPEAAAKLNIGLNECYAAAHRGELPIIRLGRTIRVLKVPFDRLLEGGKVG